jgi:hypothetical protein
MAAKVLAQNKDIFSKLITNRVRLDQGPEVSHRQPSGARRVLKMLQY